MAFSRSWFYRARFFFFLFVGLSCLTSLAQNAISGALSGLVTDPGDALVPAATLELRDNAKGIRQISSTNAIGEYSFPFLAAGNYTLLVSHAGFEQASHVLEISLGPPVTLNVRLRIAGAHAVTQVTGEAAPIRAENGDASATMNELQVAEVPNPGADLTYVAQTAPGAIMNTDYGAGNFSMLGMPGTANMFTVNGMSYTDLGTNINMTGATNLLLGLNAVQEATVVSNGYSGRFGTLAGSQVDYVTRSGGDRFHGNALYFWNGTALNANDWINNATGTTRPSDSAHQWAASIGGPIRHDRLFFFFDAEGLDLVIPSTQQVVLPSPQFAAATIANIDATFGPDSASDGFYRKLFALYGKAPGAVRAAPGSFYDPLGCTQGFVAPNGLGTTTPCAVHYQATLGRPTYELLESGRLDWSPRPADSTFLNLAYSYGAQGTYTDPISPLFDGSLKQPWWQGELVETHSFARSAVNQFVLAAWRTTYFLQLENASAAFAALPTAIDWSGARAFTSVGTSEFARRGNLVVQYQLSDDFEKTRGRHQFGFGGSLLHQHLNKLNAPDEGTLIPFTLDAFYKGGFDAATPSSDTTALSQSFLSRLDEQIDLYEAGFYGQDEWRARPNLTFTVALRGEHPSNPVCSSRCFSRLTGPFSASDRDPGQPYNQAVQVNLKQAFASVDKLNWAPRFSFAWQPLGIAHNTVVRGGLGIFYNLLPGVAANRMTTNPPPSNGLFLLGDPIAPGETTSLFKDAANSNTAFVNGFATGKTLSDLESSVEDFRPPSVVDPGRTLQSAQYQKWSLQLQQTFDLNTSVSLGYFGNHGIHELIQNASANAYRSPSVPGYPTLLPRACSSPPVLPCADPRFGEVNELKTVGVSNYNGMVLSFSHRFTGWSEGIVQVNYTYGHAFDESSNGGFFSFTSGSSVVPQDPDDLRGSYGSADYDVRQSLNASYVWGVPLKMLLHGRGPDLLVKGWQLSGTVFARGGFPYTVVDGLQADKLSAGNFFGPVYAVPAGGVSLGGACGEGAVIPQAVHPCQPAQMLADGTPNRGAAFVQAGCESGFQQGILSGSSGQCGGTPVFMAQGRNHFVGPHYFNTDLTLTKSFRIPCWEGGEADAGFQFYNVFNHPNFGLPGNDISDPAFGQISYVESPPTGVLGSGLGGDASPRNIQLKLRLRF